MALKTSVKSLRDLRTINEITQKDMAAYLGISQSTYSIKEVGQCEFTVKEAKKLLELFEMKFEELF